MDKRNSNIGSHNKLEAIHLLPDIDVESIKNYFHELIVPRYHLKRSEFTFKCLICGSSLLGKWHNIIQHLRNPSHIGRIKKFSKQFTAFCILCRHIFIADYADFIFEHFLIHKTTAVQTDKQLIQKPFENNPACHNSSNSSSSMIYRDKKNCTEQIYAVQMEKECLDDEGKFEITDNAKCRLPKHEVGCIKTSNNTRVVTSECIYSSTAAVSPQNVIPDSIKKHFYPEHAFFSNRTLQLVSPGISKDEFTIIQELDEVNIREYYEKTYYSVYYKLRKLYFSCLECKVLRIKENVFYKHLTGAKHFNNLRDCNSIGFIKICDICQVLLLGHVDLIKEHFECHAHRRNVKYKMEVIEKQFAVMSDKVKLGFSGELTDTCISFFSSKETLNSWVESSLKEAREVVSLAASLRKILERDIKKTLKEKWTNFEVKIVGSRLYELANHQSDVDIHLNIGDDVTIGDLEEYFHKADDLFEVKRTILDARVPIIRLKHLQSSVICDINTTNAAGSYCSELIKLYISLDDRVRWLAMAIMNWSAENDIRGTKKFKSYALLCLVLFFLMSPNIRMIPSVHKLQSLYDGNRIYIKGWDYSFCTDIEKIKKMHNPLLCNLNKYELLAEFFKYYLRHNAKGSVIFPHNGEVYPKKIFFNPSASIFPHIHPGIHTNQEDNEPLFFRDQFVVIDFFCLRENINKSVDENLLEHFKSITSKTLLCGWLN